MIIHRLYRDQDSDLEVLVNVDTETQIVEVCSRPQSILSFGRKFIEIRNEDQPD